LAVVWVWREGLGVSFASHTQTPDGYSGEGKRERSGQ
jgi:hypothetical protein